MNTAVKKSAKSASFSDEELLQLPLVLNSDQAAKVLGCSRSKLQSMCRADTVEYQRLQNRFSFNRDYIFKLAGISYEALYKSVSERCLAREKIKEQYAPLFKKYGWISLEARPFWAQVRPIVRLL